MTPQTVIEAGGNSDLIVPDHEKYPRAKPYHESLRTALIAYQEQHGLSLRELGRETASNETAVHRYLKGYPEGDVESFEARLADVLKTAPGKRRLAAQYFESEVTRAINALCETIRKTNDVGLIHGPAGIGKTVGIVLYTIANPSAIHLTLARWACDGEGIEQLLVRQFDTRRKKGHTRRIDFLLERLGGSSRLIIVDNAQRLTASGLEWLFDFHDATGCPIALVGNPEILEEIRRSDQLFSRIGNCPRNGIVLKRPDVMAEAMLERHCPRDAAKLETMAVKVASERGHLRALKKHLLLMPELLNACAGDVRRAFRAAHTQLVNDYTLAEEGGAA